MNRVSAPERDPYFDNARAILIALVVVGHLLLTVSSPSGEIVTIFIYMFHMPAFVFITGHLSRRFTATPTQSARLIATVMVPYVVFQTIHATLEHLLLDRPFDIHVFRPAWTLWFLLGLVVWRLATPLLRVLRMPVTIAVLVSLLAPLSPGLDQTWSMARVLGFLPFYVAGLSVSPDALARLRRPGFTWAGGAVLTALLAGAFFFVGEWRTSEFFLSSSYAERGFEPISGTLTRAAVLTVGFGGTLALLAVTGSGYSRFTRMGRYSLYVYLLHPLVLYPAEWFGVLEDFDRIRHTAALVALGLLLAWFLASPPVVHLTRWIVEPPVTGWLTKGPKDLSAVHEDESRQLPRTNAEERSSPGPQP